MKSALFLLLFIHSFVLCQAQFPTDTLYWCNGPVAVVPMSEESAQDGYPMVRIDRGGDRVYGLRYYRPVRFISAKALDAAGDACGSLSLWYNTGAWCNAQYFWRNECDTTYQRAQDLINKVVSWGTNYIHNDFDLYSEAKVFTATDSVWSVEIYRYSVPWSQSYKEVVRKDRLRIAQSRGELDTSRAAARDIIAFEWPRDLIRYEPLPDGFGVDYTYARFKPSLGDLITTIPLTFDPKTLYPVPIEHYLGPDARSMVYDQVLAYAARNPSHRINTYHYQPELERTILYTVQDGLLKLHIGEEGEMRGQYVISIPLDQ